MSGISGQWKYKNDSFHPGISKRGSGIIPNIIIIIIVIIITVIIITVIIIIIIIIIIVVIIVVITVLVIVVVVVVTIITNFINPISVILIIDFLTKIADRARVSACIDVCARMWVYVRAGAIADYFYGLWDAFLCIFLAFSDVKRNV